MTSDTTENSNDRWTDLCLSHAPVDIQRLSKQLADWYSIRSDFWLARETLSQAMQIRLPGSRPNRETDVETNAKQAFASDNTIRALVAAVAIRYGSCFNQSHCRISLSGSQDFAKKSWPLGDWAHKRLITLRDSAFAHRGEFYEPPRITLAWDGENLNVRAFCEHFRMLGALEMSFIEKHLFVLTDAATREIDKRKTRLEEMVKNWQNPVADAS